MPKIPRDLSGDELAGLLRMYGYEITRQTGSHMRLTRKDKLSEHHIIPILKQEFTVLASSCAQGRTFSATVSHISLPPCYFLDLEME